MAFAGVIMAASRKACSLLLFIAPRLKFVDLLRFRCRGAEKEGQIGACRDVACAHLNELGSETGVGAQPSDSQVFSVFAACLYGLCIRIANHTVFELARNSERRTKVVCAD